MPYGFYYGSSVVYNNEIHILGGSGSTSYVPNGENHYKWNGSSWTSVSTLPYEFYEGRAVVYNNEIDILGGDAYGTDKSKNHYYYKKDEDEIYTAVLT